MDTEHNNNMPDIEMPPLPEEQPEEQEVTQEEQPEEQEAHKEQEPQKQEHENIRQLRKAKEAAEREREEMRQYIEEMRAERSQKQQANTPQEEDDNLQPDDIPEWRHVDKHIKKLESKLAKYEQQSTLTATESRLKNQYPDFDKIVSEENIAVLRAQYPEIANTINSSQDLYSKAVSAYTMIKRLGIIPDEKVIKDKSRAAENSNKPRPLASMSAQQGDSPISRANAFAEGLTDELKEKLHKEMQEAMKYR